MWPRAECHHGCPQAGDTHGSPGPNPRCSIPSREHERRVQLRGDRGGCSTPGPSRCPGDRGGLGHGDTAGRGQRVTLLGTGEHPWPRCHSGPAAPGDGTAGESSRCPQGCGRAAHPGSRWPRCHRGSRCPGGWQCPGGSFSSRCPGGWQRAGAQPGSRRSRCARGAPGDGTDRGDHPGIRCPGDGTVGEGASRLPVPPGMLHTGGIIPGRGAPAAPGAPRCGNTRGAHPGSR